MEMMLWIANHALYRSHSKRLHLWSRWFLETYLAIYCRSNPLAVESLAPRALTGCCLCEARSSVHVHSITCEDNLLSISYEEHFILVPDGVGAKHFEDPDRLSLDMMCQVGVGHVSILPIPDE